MMTFEEKSEKGSYQFIEKLEKKVDWQRAVGKMNECKQKNERINEWMNENWKKDVFTHHRMRTRCVHFTMNV